MTIRLTRRVAEHRPSKAWPLPRLMELFPPLRERIAAWRKEHPMPPPTGQKADKALFDELSGE